MNAEPKPPPEELARRLAYVLCRAWIEARNACEDHERIFELADVMHNVPLLLVNCTDNWLELTRHELARYGAKYPSTYNYLSYLEGGVPQASEWLWLWEDAEPSEQPPS